MPRRPLPRRDQAAVTKEALPVLLGALFNESEQLGSHSRFPDLNVEACQPLVQELPYIMCRGKRKRQPILAVSWTVGSSNSAVVIIFGVIPESVGMPRALAAFSAPSTTQRVFTALATNS